MQGGVLLGMHFVGNKRVLGTHEPQRERGTAGIERELARCVLRPHRVEVDRKQRGQGGWQGLALGAQQAANAGAPFLGLCRFGGVELVTAATGMRIDDAEGGRFALQVVDRQGKHGMLHHIGKVARMIGVAVVHGLAVTGSGPPAMRKAYFMVGITNSAPSLTPEGQRDVTVLVLV